MSAPLQSLSASQPMGLSYRIGWTFFRLLFATYFHWRYFNPERVPLSGPVILASNHASFLDPPLVGSALHRGLHFLARDTLFRYPLVGALLRSWDAVPVDRDGGGAAGLRRILDVVESGHAIIIFPEGTRTRDGQLQRARSGIGLIVLKAKAPVIPIRVFGTFEAYGRGARFPKSHRVSVKYGRPQNFEALRLEAQTCDKARLKAIYQQIADQIMAEIANLQPFEDKEAFPS